MDLVLPLKAEYFHQIREGSKVEEYRLYNAFWRKRLEGKTFDRIVLTLGYPSRHAKDRRLIKPWKGYTVKTIEHPHFGDYPVEVFAISVGGPCHV